MKKNMSKQLATALRAACIGALVLGIGGWSEYTLIHSR